MICYGGISTVGTGRYVHVEQPSISLCEALLPRVHVRQQLTRVRVQRTLVRDPQQRTSLLLYALLPRLHRSINLHPTARSKGRTRNLV